MTSLRPQSTGSNFRIGRFGFTQEEKNRLAKAYERVTSEKCQKSRITPSTLSRALSITTLNKYSPALTAQQVGVREKDWAEVKSKFDNPQGTKYASGVTLRDGRVFLTDNAFYISGAISGLRYNSTDLSGVIVHELFHRSGLSESQVISLHEDIQKNCGIPGYAL